MAERLRTVLVFPAPGRKRWRDHVETLDAVARRLEDALAESGAAEDVVRSVTGLAVPDLADLCGVDVVEGDRTTRFAFAHRNPKITAQAAALLDDKAHLHEFAFGRRALAGECVLLKYSEEPLGPPGARSPVMDELLDTLRPASAVLIPFVVLGATIAVASFVRSVEYGLTQGPRELALGQEVVRRAIIRNAGFSAPRFTRTEDFRLRRVDDYIRENLASSLSLQAMARQAGLSRFHLLRLFKQAYGETPFKRLTRLRMEEAQRRLIRTTESVTAIAFACGYEDSAHFASAFRRTFGIAPTKFRRLAR